MVKANEKGVRGSVRKGGDAQIVKHGDRQTALHAEFQIMTSVTSSGMTGEEEKSILVAVGRVL